MHLLASCLVRNRRTEQKKFENNNFQLELSDVKYAKILYFSGYAVKLIQFRSLSISTN